MANTLAQQLAAPSPRDRGPILPDFTQGIAALPRGAISEILGTTSTGRTAFAQNALVTATLGGEISAWIDCTDSFDPASAESAGADLGKMLWVQCGHRLEVALKAADMVLHSGGFGLIVLDLCGVSASVLQRVPLSYWYRIRNAVEHTPSVLLVLGRDSIARACASRQFDLKKSGLEWRGLPPFQTMVRLEVNAASRKPMSTTSSSFEILATVSEAD